MTLACTQVCPPAESPEITGIHQTHQIPPKFTSFHRSMIGCDSCCRFVFKRLRVGTRLAFSRDSVEMARHKATGKREAMNGMNYELASVEPIEQIFAAGAPFLLVAASVVPPLELSDDTITGASATDLDWANTALPSKAFYCSRAAQKEERNGFKYTAAMKWRSAAELFAPDTQAVEYCWHEWERIMHLPRRLAGPACAAQTIARVI
jgi:hypothetical protein